MGGSILFTSNGTFSPSLYGLTTGKFINYIIIGGGGAGESIGCFSSFTFNGTSTSSRNSFVLNSGGSNGGTSSIGSYISATGGSTVTKTGSSYSSFYPSTFDDGTYSYNNVYGGSGAGGWVPGKIFNSYQSGYSPTATSSSTSSLPSYIYALTYDGQKFLYMHDWNSYGYAAAITAYAPTTNNSSTYGGGTPNPYNLTQNAGTSHQGSDGIGYGSGGGGCAYLMHLYYRGSDNNYAAGKGGSSGQFKQGSFKLTSTNDIAITIGAGGTPHTTMGSPFTSATKYSSDSDYQQYGRIGTQGAAMLFWD